MVLCSHLDLILVNDDLTIQFNVFPYGHKKFLSIFYWKLLFYDTFVINQVSIYVYLVLDFLFCFIDLFVYPMPITTLF